MNKNEKNGSIPDICEKCGKNIAMIKAEGLWMCGSCARERAEEIRENGRRIATDVAKRRQSLGL